MSEPISVHGYGHWMKNAADTRLYFYWENVNPLMGEESMMYGRRSRAGAVVAGDVQVYLDALTTIATPTIEIDADATGPYLGCLRWTFVTT